MNWDEKKKKKKKKKMLGLMDLMCAEKFLCAKGLMCANSQSQP